MKRGIMLLAALLLFAVLTACGMGERKQVETLFAQAVQEYAARESVELHLTVTNVLESGTFIQNDTMNVGGDLVRLLTRDYNRNMEYLEQELSILNWNSPVCAEKIEETYTRLSESVK